MKTMSDIEPANAAQREALNHAMRAAQLRLLPAAATAAERDSHRDTMRSSLADAMLALLQAEEHALRAGESERADAIAQVRWAARSV